MRCRNHPVQLGCCFSSQFDVIHTGELSEIRQVVGIHTEGDHIAHTCSPCEDITTDRVERLVHLGQETDHAPTMDECCRIVPLRGLDEILCFRMRGDQGFQFCYADRCIGGHADLSNSRGQTKNDERTE
jgi:hypothetical protein